MAHQVNDTPTLNYWPIIIIIEDCYIPELAPDVTKAARESTTETLAGVLDFIVWKTMRDWSSVRHN